MATRVINTRLALTGESEYKRTVTSINNSLSTLKSELALVDSQFKGNANSMEALRAKGDVLQRQYLDQKDKLASLSTALEEARKAKARFSDQVEQSSGKLARDRGKLEELKNATANTAVQEAKLTAEIKKNEDALAALEQAQQRAGNSVNYLQRQVNNTQRSINELNRELSQNRNYQTEAAASANHCATSIDEMGRATRQTRDDAQGMAEAVQALTAALAAAGMAQGVEEIAQALKACVSASIEFESAMAGVRRTVGGSDAEIAAFGESFRTLSLDIPTTTTTLGKIAETAGQLGISKEYVLEFTRVMSMLATTTDLTAENAATMLAQFSNVTGTTDYARLGATVAQLGDATATTASKVVEMSQGMAAAASIAGLSETDILAVSAAVGSLGIEAEAGSTAMATLISTLFKAVEMGGEKLSAFAAVANMSAMEFKKAWKTDAAHALDAMLQGLNDTERNGRNAIVILEELGLTNVRQTKAILGLAEAGGLLSNTLEQASRAWEENTALEDKATIMYATTESQLLLLNNAFDGVKVAIGNVLLPALRVVAETGRDAFVWAAAFIEEHPWLVQAITAVTVALGSFLKLSTALAAFTVAIKAVGAVLMGLGTVTVPILGVIAAVAGLVTAIGLYAASQSQVDSRTKKLTEDMEKSRKAYDETAAAIKVSNSDTMAQVAALTTLVDTEHKTAAQKAALLALVEQLNESVPSLNLAYDEQTNSLKNMETGAMLTTDAIREMALAQAEQEERAAAVGRLKALYVEEATIQADLTAATLEATAAQAELARMQQEGTYGAQGYAAATKEVEKKLQDCQGRITALNGAVDENTAQTQAMEKEYGKLTQSTDLTATSLQGAAADAQALTLTIGELTAATGKQTDTTKALVSQTDQLSAAFAEQRDNGSLSLKTMFSLIDAGYAAALSIDAETGAVRLNAEAYMTMANAKIEEQLSSANDALRDNTAKALEQEGIAANFAANGYASLATSHIAEAEAARGNVAEAQASIAALKALQENLGKVISGNWNSAPSRVKSSSSKSAAKSEADTRVEAYQAAMKELDFLRDIGEKDEEAYYKQLEVLRDKYLKKDTEQWRSATVKLYEWQKKKDEDAAAAKEKALAEAAQAKTDAYNKSLADLNYFLKMELISEEAYYRQLAALRDQHLETDSAAWRSANESLFSYQKEQQQKQLDALKAQLEAEKDAIEDWYDAEEDALEKHYDAQKDAASDAYDAEKTAAKDAYDAEKKAAKDAYEARKAQIKETLALEKERLNAIIAGIDQEIQARRELREDEGQDDAIARAQKKLDAAEAELAFARTDEDKEQWRQEVYRLEQALQDAIQDKEDTAFYREKELEKEAVRDQITAAEDAASQDLTTADGAYAQTVAQLEASYASKTAQLESAYQEKLRQLETDYQQALADLKAESARRLQEAEEEHRKAEQALKDSFNKKDSDTGTGGGSSDGFGGNGNPSDYVTNWDSINGGDVKNAGAALAAAAAAGAAAGASSVVNHNTRTNSANVNIYQASSLTEGQIVGAVQKALDRISK